MKSIAFILPKPDSTAQQYLSELIVNLKNSQIFYLCPDPNIQKILKADVNLNVEELINTFDIISPIGADSFKYICKQSNITRYSGYLMDEKYFPLINPAQIAFKPQVRDELEKAIRTLEAYANGEKGEQVETDYALIETSTEFEKLLDYIYEAEVLGVDTETTGFSAKKNSLIGVSFSWKPHQGIFVLKEAILPFVEELRAHLKTRKCVFHNAKFDQHFLYEEFGWEFDNFDDTILLHYCLEEKVGTHGLKDLAIRFTTLGDYEADLERFKKEYCRASKIKLEDFSYDMIPMDILAPYAAKDTDGTLQLRFKFYPLVNANDKFKWVYENLLIPSSKALLIVERNGGPINRTQLMELQESFKIDVEECLEEIFQHPAVAELEHLQNKSFNPNSVVQLRKLFFDVLHLNPIKKTAGGEWSTDVEVLESLDHPLAAAILDLRSSNKMLGTYADAIEAGLDPDGRLRSTFNIQGTTSGRLSSSGNLNYQNIPRDRKEIKKLFAARPGYKIVQGDLKTAEVYVAAVLAKDIFLQKAFIENLDFHSYIAKQIFNLPCKVEEVKAKFPDHRQWAKAITFGIMYQAGPGKIGEEANVSYQEAKEFIEKYFREAHGLKSYIDSSNAFISNNAYLYSFFGRKRRLPESKSPNRAVAGHAIRSGVNFLVQSVASDINLLGLVDAMNWIAENNYSQDILPFTIVHDSIVAEVREDLIPLWTQSLLGFIQKDRGVMIPNCPIKMDFEVGPSWGDLSTIKV